MATCLTGAAEQLVSLAYKGSEAGKCHYTDMYIYIWGNIGFRVKDMNLSYFVGI